MAAARAHTHAPTPLAAARAKLEQYLGEDKEEAGPSSLHEVCVGVWVCGCGCGCVWVWVGGCGGGSARVGVCVCGVVWGDVSLGLPN